MRVRAQLTTMSSKRRCQVGVVCVSALITISCIVCLLLPTLLIIHYEWQYVVDLSRRNEYAPRTAYLRSGLTAEIETASRNLVHSLTRFTLLAESHRALLTWFISDVNNTTDGNLSYLPFVQRVTMGLVASMFEREPLRPHSHSLYVDDRSAALGSISIHPTSSLSDREQTSATVWTFFDSAALPIVPPTPGVNFSLADAPQAAAMRFQSSFRDVVSVSPILLLQQAVRHTFPAPLVEMKLGVTPNRGDLVLDIRKVSTDMLASMIGLPPSSSSISPLADVRQVTRTNKFDRQQFDDLLSFFGPPTPNSWLLLEYDGLVLGSYVPPAHASLIPALSIRLSIVSPLRTPSGYNCFVDVSGSRFASCVLLITALPLYGTYASVGTTGSLDQPVTVAFNGNEYSVASIDLTSVSGMWALSDLRLHVFLSVDDLNACRRGVLEIYIGSIVLSVVVIALVLLSVGRWKRTFSDLRFTADVVQHWLKSPPPTDDAGLPTLRLIPPMMTLSIFSELRSAQLEFFCVVQRLVDVSSTLQWVSAVAPQAQLDNTARGGSSGVNTEDDNHGPIEGVPTGADSNVVVPSPEIDLMSEAASSLFQFSTTNASTAALVEHHLASASTKTGGKATNSFLMLHIKRRTLDPALRTQCVLFASAFEVLQRHNAIVESVNHNMVLASFRSKQHALRAVECARTLTATLDTLAAADCLSDDIKCFVVCHQGTTLRWRVGDMLAGAFVTAQQQQQRDENVGSAASGGLPLGVDLPSGAPSPPQVTIRGGSSKDVLLTTIAPDTSADAIALIADLQCSVLRSRLILTSALVASLPQRIASVLTPVDFISLDCHNVVTPTDEIAQGGGAGHEPAAVPLPMTLFEDPTVECVMRTHFVIARRLKLAAAFGHLTAGELDDAMKALEDFSGDPTAVDLCEWHAYRWRRWVVGAARGGGQHTGGSNIADHKQPSVVVKYIRRLNSVQQVSNIAA